MAVSVKVKVPATTANVCCGFDTLGIALDLYAYFNFEIIKEGLEIIGCDQKYANEENLVYTSFQKALAMLGKEVSGVRIVIDTKVPVARGLGSSSTCVVGGILGAYALCQIPVDKDAVFALAASIEGHPDNVAPAVYGGLCASFKEGEQNFTMCYSVDERFMFQALIPDFETKTSEARKVLPSKISYQDALYNVSHVSGVIYGLEKYQLTILKAALHDRLHEPYRKQLIDEFEQVKCICENNDSLGFFISGSGSTLMNLPASKENAAMIKTQLKQCKHHWESKILHADTKGAMIIDEE